jgi:hypothetical protein
MKKGFAESAEETLVMSDREMKSSSKLSGFASENRAAAGTEGNVDFGTFPLNQGPKES